MAVSTQKLREAFDFSRDAQAFKVRLWKQLQEQMASLSVQELDDDDLELINAAGTPFTVPDQNDPIS